MKRILLIDDSMIQHRIIGVMLKGQYELISSTSGVEGIGIAKKQQPDLILLDYDMPVMSGKATFRKLQEQEETKDIPVIFLTGVNDEKAVMEVLRLRPQGYLLKPVEPESLLKALDKAFADKEQKENPDEESVQDTLIDPVHGLTLDPNGVIDPFPELTGEQDGLTEPIRELTGEPDGVVDPFQDLVMEPDGFIDPFQDLIGGLDELVEPIRELKREEES